MTRGGGTVPYRGSPGSKYTFDSRFTLTSPTLHGGARAGSGAVVVVVGTVVVGTVVGAAVVGAAVVVGAVVAAVVELGAMVAALESSPPHALRASAATSPIVIHRARRTSG